MFDAIFAGQELRQYLPEDLDEADRTEAYIQAWTDLKTELAGKALLLEGLLRAARMALPALARHGCDTEAQALRLAIANAEDFQEEVVQPIPHSCE